MKKYLYILVALLAFAACSHEMELPNSEPASDGALKISVKFPGRTFGTPQTYAGTFPAEDFEKSLSNVRIYIFNDDTGQPGKLLGTEPVTPGTGDTEAGVSATFFMRHFGNLHLVAVANLDFDKAKIDAMGGISFAAFSKTLVTQPAGTPNAFVMASEPLSVTIPDPQSGTPAPALSFLLERLSARIDIENFTTDDGGGEFVLAGARLRLGNIDRSYLIKGQTPPLVAGIDGAKHLAGIEWTENQGVSGDTKKMYAKLYTYENVANTLVVQVKGTFKGVPAQFDLPFGDKEVKRNTRYLVRVNNFVGNKVNFDIVVADWNEGGEIPFKPGTDATQPTVVAIAAADANGDPATQAHTLTYSSGTDPDNVTAIALDNPTLYYTKITVESPSTESMILVNKAEVPWLTVQELGESSIEGGKLRQEFLVTYGGTNDRYPRAAQLEIQNKFVPDKINPKLINVTQPGNAASSVLLARLSNANVDNLNQFATAITPDNVSADEVMGKLYQWGRNVPFDYSVAPVVSNTRVNANDAAVWGNNLIVPGANPHNWLDNAFAGDTWTTLVAKATSAPAGYTGTNGGDPCPNGWRLPEEGEYLAMFPSPIQDEVNFFGNVNKKGYAEQITINGATTDYTADYYSTTPNVLYALKMKGAGNAQLTAYRYEYRDNLGLWVIARHLGAAGAAVTVEQIAVDSYWATDAAGDVIRYFPSAGYYNIYGTAVLRGNYGRYWSSSERNAINAWYLYFNDASVFRSNNLKSSAFSLRCVRD